MARRRVDVSTKKRLGSDSSTETINPKPSSSTEDTLDEVITSSEHLQDKSDRDQGARYATPGASPPWSSATDEDAEEDVNFDPIATFQKDPMYVANCSNANLKVVRLPGGVCGVVYVGDEMPAKLDSINAPTIRFCGIAHPSTNLGEPSAKGWSVGLAIRYSDVVKTRDIIKRTISDYCIDQSRSSVGADSAAAKLLWNYTVRNKSDHNWAWFNYDHKLFVEGSRESWPALYDARVPEGEHGFERMNALHHKFDESTVLGVEGQLVLDRFQTSNPASTYPRFKIGAVFYLGADRATQEDAESIITPDSPVRYKSRRIG